MSRYYYLPEEIRKYYREGKFRNRVTGRSYSSNDMNDELGLSPGSGFLSRVMNGERKLSYKHLQKFCKILDLSPAERASLEFALIRDESEASTPLFFILGEPPSLPFKARNMDYKTASDPGISRPVKMVNDPRYYEMFEIYLNRELELIRKCRIGGNPQRAIAEASTSLAKLDQIRNELSLTPTFQRKIEPIRGRILYEKALACREAWLPAQAFAVTKAVILELRDIFLDTKNLVIAGLEAFSLADGFYIKHDYKSAVSQFELAKPHASLDARLMILRGIGICCANLNQPNDYFKARHEAEQLIQGCKFCRVDIVCAVYEGFAWAELILGLPSAERRLAEAEQTFNRFKHEVEQVPLRSIQLGRTKIEFLRRSESAIRMELERLGIPILSVATSHGYIRHQQEISALLK